MKNARVSEMKMRRYGRHIARDSDRSMMYIFGMDMITTVAATAVLAFFIGSVPTAYLLVRRHHQKDIRQEGSGNVGTLNAYEVTRSKTLGISVLLIDLAKGALPMLLLIVFPRGEDTHLAAAVALVAVVAGHNYSPWIGWKGGRGLAPAAGAALLFSPLFIVAWGVFWVGAFWRSRNVHFGNIAATVLSPFVVLIVPAPFLAVGAVRIPTAVPLVVAFFLLSALVLLRHAEPLRVLFSSHRHQ